MHSTPRTELGRGEAGLSAGGNDKDKATGLESENSGLGGEEAETREGRPWVSARHVLLLDLYGYCVRVHNVILTM